MRRALFASLLSLAAVTAPRLSMAQGWIIPRPCIMDVQPIRDVRPMPMRDCGANIARSRSDVRVELADHVLRYEVEERFINRGGTVGEADYLFPLPNGAAFQDLKLSINGELVSGEMMNAGDARRIYESIVRAQRDPALVEWMGHGLVRARIFPLNPGEEKRVVIRFQSVAPREGDALRIDYFRGTPRANQRVVNVRDDGTTSFMVSYKPSDELGNPYSPTHRLDIADRGGRREVTVRGDARDVTLLIPVRKSSAASIAMLPYAPGNEDGFALITVSPPATRRDETTPRDVTLVLDVSGSMSGRKIEQARAAGKQLLGTLRPSDRFRLIDFSSDVHTFRDDFVAASPDNVRDAMRYFDALEANGSTNIEGALREALRVTSPSGRLPLVLFVTDGEPTIGERSAEGLTAIAAPLRRDARVFTFGLGADVNVSLLEQLALDGRGTSQFVRPDESVERMVGVVAERLVDPVLTDVRVHADGDIKLSRMLPTQASDIFADRDLVLFARYSGKGAARIVVEGKRRGVPVRWESTVNFPDRERDNPFVARLWATQRVGFLSAEKHKNGGNAEVDDEIRSLGERYGIPTEFTSYLVTEPKLAMVGMTRGTIGLQSVTATGAASPMPAAAPMRDMRFESAKAASEQRAVTNAATLDSISSASDGVAGTRRVDGRTFVFRDGVWTDARFKTGMQKTVIKPFSKAYFDLVDQLPELRTAFTIGERVIVVGKNAAIELNESGISELSASALSGIARSW
ncbi:MAG TPA: VIT domain-containing protein [Gemmatimonadaceae bacterium]|jgi:Ca-activated chloride channel family protein